MNGEGWGDRVDPLVVFIAFDAAKLFGDLPGVGATGVANDAKRDLGRYLLFAEQTERPVVVLLTKVDLLKVAVAKKSQSASVREMSRAIKSLTEQLRAKCNDEKADEADLVRTNREARGWKAEIGVLEKELDAAVEPEVAQAIDRLGALVEEVFGDKIVGVEYVTNMTVPTAKESSAYAALLQDASITTTAEDEYRAWEAAQREKHDEILDRLHRMLNLPLSLVSSRTTTS